MIALRIRYSIRAHLVRPIAGLKNSIALRGDVFPHFVFARDAFNEVNYFELTPDELGLVVNRHLVYSSTLFRRNVLHFHHRHHCPTSCEQGGYQPKEDLFF